MTSFSRRTDLLAAGLLAGALVHIACGDNRGGDVPAIRAAFERVPGVRVVDAVGWDEMWPAFGPEDIRVMLTIRSEGRLTLCDVALDTLDAPAEFRIARVGPWTPVVQIEEPGAVTRVAGCPEALPIGPGSPFPELASFSVASPMDAVRHYDELEALVASWPERCAYFHDRSGRRWSYRKLR